MKIDVTAIQKGAVTSVSPLYSDLLKTDTRVPHPAFAATGEFIVDGGPVPRSRYIDRAFAKLEMDHLWMKTWQVVGREEDIPEIGDRFVYNVGNKSFIIVRTAENSVKALYNSCLHRGTRLCAGEGAGPVIRCPFHGWTWNADGSIKELPGRWDFPEVTDEKFRLPEAQCAVWGGNIFINPDLNAGPLEPALGILVDHFKDYEFADRWTAVHVRKKVRGNWKLAAEAFLEGWHLSETHSQAQSFNGDSNSQYDIWEDDDAQISRSITPSGVPSPELGEDASVRQAVIDLIHAVTPPGMELPNFEQVETIDRAYGAEHRRRVLNAMTGRDSSDASDAWMLDAAQYYMFPNFFPWLGEGAPLWYQFMPYGDDPAECIFEVRFLLPMPANGERPPKSPVVEIDFDETFRSQNAGFGLFDEVFDQDMSNVPLIQKGCETGSPDSKYVYFGTYQECRLKALHARLAKMVGV
ncbi:aromatic ring-hydroxylating dioxygenase subunit alpha [Sphingomonas aliaeris]|uniref:Aromatic ring-hydroxylating dioxygenase subunit alpha n=1 Tax=Sphingomonas aliaeris TaxID=2759526 RepID=A0A974NVN5_9SPHN|nr:aromatic ring-hydroxylating dioxygenase subunit alpha [Sphingomonas aliaeris]QQV77662.1 aromatic ring-hydroxylating dioxygenase subunit alpha [Sphingomonas aliaeris]